MFATGTRRAEKFVSNRRMQEDRINTLQSKLREEFQMKELAKFENKGKGVAQTNYIKQRLTDLRQRHVQNIEVKRHKLKDLLDRENDQYKFEIRNLEDTPEQVREKMVARVTELRAQKEAERQQEVAEKLDRRFREGADELRKVESEINELKNMHLRNIQMQEKHHLMEQQYHEDMIYAELWKRDMLRKAQKEQEEIEDKRRKNQERNVVLGWQKEENTKVRQSEQERIEAEKRMLKENWELEAQRQRELERRTFETNKELNNELFEHNIAQRAIKDELMRREKTSDKQMVDNIVNREKMLDHLEAEYRERQKRETREFLLNFKNRTNELHTQEAELERLVHEEMEKQYRKQQEQWKKEEDARIKLMYQVYDSRAADIDRKHQIASDIKVEKEVEKDTLTKDILDYEEELRRKKEEELRRNKTQQNVIVGQMVDKREMEKRRLQDKMAQEKADILAQQEYMRRVQEEKEKGRRMLEELRKQRPF